MFVRHKNKVIGGRSSEHEVKKETIEKMITTQKMNRLAWMEAEDMINGIRACLKIPRTCPFKTQCSYFRESSYTCAENPGRYCGKYREYEDGTR